MADGADEMTFRCALRAPEFWLMFVTALAAFLLGILSRWLWW
jgi:hypothetical protein